MIDRTLAYLDFTKLLDIINRYSSTPFSREIIASIRPTTDLDFIRTRQEKTEGVLDLVRFSGKAPLGDLSDIRDLLRRVAVRDTVLAPEDLLKIASFAGGVEGLRRFLQSVPPGNGYARDLIDRLDPLVALNRRIGKTINIDGFIEDTASYELSKIRSDLFSYRERIRRNLEAVMERESVRPILQDSYIAIRNGRYVLPFKPNFNQAIQGIVHDYSHSLKTSFVEPVEVLELNNSINMLAEEEREEEKRILRELTQFLGQFTGELENDFELVQEFDVHQSLALFALEFDCVKPSLRPDPVLEVRNARNPFIVLSKGNRAVPVDILMDAETKALVVSGPNAGGKTAALKTIGLLTAMAQSGFFIPASHNPQVGLFESISAVMGDEQDIAMELSSFTAHLLAIKELLQRSEQHQLVLIDEIAGGTDPQEASALAMGIIDAFVERGCKVIVTTHLNALKAYGFSKAFAINVATSYDEKTYRPKYTLVYGSAGFSNALHVARETGFPEEIIDHSFQYLGKQEHMLNELLTELDEEKKRVAEELAEVSKIKEEQRRRLTLLRDKKDELRARFEANCQKRMQAFEEELAELEREIASREKDAIKEVRGRAERVKKRIGMPVSVAEQSFGVGDYVRIKSLGTTGFVTAVDEKKGLYEIAGESVRTRVHKRFLEKLKTPPPGKGSGKNQFSLVAEPEPSELNIQGMRVEDAIDALDSFLDKAVVNGKDTVKIRHGVGTGRLMGAVRDHLISVVKVKSARPDERNAGITVVEL